MRRGPLKRSTAAAPTLFARNSWIAPLCAGLLAALVYANALHNPFVYDDHDTVVANPSLADLSNTRFLLVFSPFRPVVNVSYGIDRFFWGTGPLGFHVTNVALHAVASMLLCVLLRELLRDGGLRRQSETAALVGAGLFAVHPIQTEAAGYISGRSELLCAVWFLGALIAARRAIMSGGVRAAAIAAACGLLALASKEVAVMLPAIVAVYAWLLGASASRVDVRADSRAIDAESVQAASTSGHRALRLVFIVGSAVLIVAAGFRLAAFWPLAGGLSLHATALNVLTQSIVVWRYVGLILWPHGQAIMHSVHVVTTPVDLLALAACAGIILLVTVAIGLRRRRPLVTFGVLWFLAVLAPSSSIIPLREGMAEHRVYLASAGLFLILADQAARWMEGTGRATFRLRAGLVAATCIVLVVLGTLTLRRNQVWGSAVSLWTEATVQAAGMWEPSYALGDALREGGDCARAVPAYRSVLELRPRHRDAHTNLGICLAQTGQLEEAERSFRRALEIDPGFARGYTNLGALALVSGDAESARTFYIQAVAHDNGNVLARLQLASLFEHTFKDYHSAARMCAEARLIAPSTPGVVECVERNQQLAIARDTGR